MTTLFDAVESWLAGCPELATITSALAAIAAEV
jgi:hypothetical protein